MTVFESPDQLKQWQKDFGSLVSQSVLVYGNAWMVITTEAEDVPAVKAALGV